MELDRIVEAFLARYPGEAPRCFRAPGRVNLIGEHTDYNDGFVLPMALDRFTAVAVRPRSDRRLHVWSENMEEACVLPLERSAPGRSHWSDYIAGVAWALEERGVRLPGADLHVESTVPVGAGLSSSAAIEIAAALALLSTAARTLAPVDLARLGQRAENAFVGMQCGIMDPFVSVHGVAGHALFLDCRSLAYRPVPLASDRVRVVIADSRVKHELAASAYNRRRAECGEGVAILKRIYPGVEALRDVSPGQFDAQSGAMTETVRRRCRHVILENARVLDSVAALEEGDPVRFGRLMDASHASLRDDYEVSCRELDTLVEIARGLPGCLGARMTGGGFGGCTVNLVEPGRLDRFRSDLARGYRQATGVEPAIHVSAPSGGAGEWTA